jgi:tyrosyl-tRNA synthetase
VFREHELPSELPEVTVDVPAGLMTVIVQSGLAASNNEARRLIEQGGVRLGGVRVTAAGETVHLSEPTVLQVGRRRFVRLLPRA